MQISGACANSTAPWRDVRSNVKGVGVQVKVKYAYFVMHEFCPPKDTAPVFSPPKKKWMLCSSNL